MNVANLLFTYGKPLTGQKWLLENIRFDYLGNFWHIHIGKRTYEVSDILAGQIAYALIVDADIDMIQESIEEDEIDPVDEDDEEIDAERSTRAEYVKALIQKYKKPPHNYKKAGMYQHG